VSIAAADATAIAWRRESWDLRDVDTAVGLLTYVAACAVLAARFAWELASVATSGLAIVFVELRIMFFALVSGCWPCVSTAR